LRSRLLERKQREEAEKHSAARKSQVGGGDRSEKIRTYNYPQNRVTDHRIEMTLYNLDRFMEGEVQQMFDALAQADLDERLAAASIE
jgi:peptide chain release factor 1